MTLLDSPTPRKPLRVSTRRGPVAVLALVSLGFTLVVAPVAIATPAVPLGAPSASAAPKRDAGVTRVAPDPPAMIERGQWVFDLRWDKGDVYLLGVHALTLSAAQATPRAMGRFAIELYEGPTLIERVRFDFPLLGAGELSEGGIHAPPSFERKLVTRIGVMFPATTKGTKLELWDRATGQRWPLPWLPEETALVAKPGDAGDAGRPSLDGG